MYKTTWVALDQQIFMGENDSVYLSDYAYAKPKDILIYLDQMNIYLFEPVELKIWYARARKNARCGATSHEREVKPSPMWRKFSSTPENTLILKDSLKIDPFRPWSMNINSFKYDTHAYRNTPTTANLAMTEKWKYVQSKGNFPAPQKTP